MLKNIVVACDYAFFEGGAANVAMQSVIALAKNTDLNVYCFAGNGEPCKELKACGATIIALNYPDLLGNPSKVDAFLKGIYNKNVYKKMKELLCTLDPEETIVHIHTWTKVLTSAVFKACEETKFPTYLTIHEYFLACPNGACYDYVGQKICEKKPLSMKCLTCNCDARNYPQKIWRCIRQFKQNSVIRHNKDLNYIFISPYQRKQLLRRIPSVKNKFLVKNPINAGSSYTIDAGANSDYAYIGRLSGEKGIELFCEAVTKAGVHGVVMGKGLLEDELKKKYPNINFMGWMNKEQMDEQLKHCRALIFPTLWYEGSPLTVPEVLSHGLPCIVTNCSSAIDDITHGENGEIVEPNCDSMVAAIHRFEDNTYIAKMSSNATLKFDARRANEKYYVENLLKVYERR